MNFTTEIIPGPAHFAPALVNGDPVPEPELAEYQAFATYLNLNPLDIITVDETSEPYFSWSYYLHSPGCQPGVIGGTLVDYTVLRAI